MASRRPLDPPREVDLVVVGSGAAGLAAAVTAAHLGLEAVVLEKHAKFGGTTAWSGGWLWIPRNRHARAAGIDEPIAAPRAYLENELGAGFDATRIDRFLEQAPRMVDFFEEKTAVRFFGGNAIPDFHGRSPSAGVGGRSVCAEPCDGRILGGRLGDLRPPLDLVSPFGMGIGSGADLRHFLEATRSLRSFLHVVRRLARHTFDLLRAGRGLHLVAGNALIARLARSAFDRGVEIVVSTPVVGLIRDDGRIAGVRIAVDGSAHEIRARRGVVLACGGFPHDEARKAALFPHAPTGREHWSAAPPENSGDGLHLGEHAGGRVEVGAHAGAWAPVSLVARADGSTGAFPHLIDRGKPGLIAVRRDGRRFVDEAGSYHDFMNGLFAATPAGEAQRAWLVVDHAFQRHYGLGHARPRPFPLRPWLRSGYLKRGRTLRELAEVCGIDPDGLEATVARYNVAARTGDDPEFGRGTVPYERMQGDPGHGPNPCVAPIERAPFYAVEIVPGSLGTFAGLATDADARVLDRSGAPIAGLYAVGNDMASIMAGRYPAGGITLGPAMTFGFVAAHHAAGRPLPSADAPPTAI
jgi:succinate dehydrogenase/fumarate reductase flavoprotein subunit